MIALSNRWIYIKTNKEKKIFISKNINTISLVVLKRV